MIDGGSKHPRKDRRSSPRLASDESTAGTRGDRFRLGEAAREAGILDGLPAQVALLDAHARVVSVNAAWSRFAAANGMPEAACGAGADYLAVCDAARGPCSAEAPAVAEGIRAVLGGRSRHFSIEYPCHSPSEHRWFLLTVTPLAEGDLIGAVVMHADISERKRLNRMNTMLSGVNGAIVRIRHRQALLDEACRIAVETGGLAFAWVVTVDEAENRCRPVASAGAGGDYLEIVTARMSLADDAPGGQGISVRAIREGRAIVVDDVSRDAAVKFGAQIAARGVRSMASLPIFIEGRPTGAFAFHASERGFFDDAEMRLLRELVDNIAFALEHLEKEEKVRRLTRVYAVLSGINSLIVRAVDRDQLFREACRVAVEQGGFPLAWIAVVDKPSGTLVPIATAGDVGDFFATSRLATDHNRPGGTGLPGRAVREMKPMISNDVSHDPSIFAKRDLADRGINSAAALPLVVRGEAIGVLALYSPDMAFFDDEEIRLLQDLAGDIAFAVDHIEKVDRLAYLAYYDALTGLPNRSLFLGRVADGMRKAAAGGHKLALVLIDLERFKSFNDTLGRHAGDALLKEVAQWLAHRMGDPELVAHLGADHFAALVPAVGSDAALGRLLERTLKAFLIHPFAPAEGRFRINARVGVAVFPNDGASSDILFKNAEAALKKAKASGNRLLFYKSTMTESVAGKLTLENQLRQALENGEFVLHYQPKLSLPGCGLSGAEALIRWNDPRTGLVPPGRFIPVLEEIGLIHDVGRWALRQALSDYLRWRAAGLPAVRVAVNVSPLQLRSKGFIAEIRQAIGIDPHAASGLELEITESLIMEDVKHTIATLQAVREMGVTVSIDDFGTGFSSLSYLAKLPIDTVKIDRSFVADMAKGPEGLALVSTIIGLAHSLRLKVVAEGVETEEQSRLLRLLDCDEMQGFLFSKPIAVGAFETAFLGAPGPR